MANTSGNRVYIDLRNSLAYTNEMERPSRNNFKLKLIIETKIPLRKKNEASGLGLYKWEIFLYAAWGKLNVKI